MHLAVNQFAPSLWTHSLWSLTSIYWKVLCFLLSSFSFLYTFKHSPLQNAEKRSFVKSFQSGCLILLIFFLKLPMNQIKQHNKMPFVIRLAVIVLPWLFSLLLNGKSLSLFEGSSTLEIVYVLRQIHFQYDVKKTSTFLETFCPFPTIIFLYFFFNRYTTES